MLNPLKEKLNKIKKRKKENYVFSDEEPMTAKVFNKKFQDFKNKTGIKSTIHQLRHSFATRAFEIGLNPKTVQEIIGHKQVSTTLDMYTDFRKKALEDTTKIMNEKFD